MLDIGIALILAGAGILVTAFIASDHSLVKRISPGVAFVIGGLLVAGGLLVILWPSDSTTAANDAPSPTASLKQEVPNASPSSGIQDLNPAPELNQTVTIGGTPKQGHTYLLTAAGCPGSEVRAESHVKSSTAELAFEVVLADDAPPETRVKVSIIQSERPTVEKNLNHLDPVSVAVGLDEGNFTLAFSSQNGASIDCADTEFTMLLRNYVLSEG